MKIEEEKWNENIKMFLNGGMMRLSSSPSLFKHWKSLSYFYLKKNVFVRQAISGKRYNVHIATIDEEMLS